MKIEFKKAANNKYQHKQPDGTIKEYSEQDLVKLRSAGHEVLVDGVQFYITPANAANVNKTEKIYNFTTKNYRDFAWDKTGQLTNAIKIRSNLQKGLKLTINNSPIRLTRDGSTFEFVDKQMQAEYEAIINKTFDMSKTNVDSIMANTPATSTVNIAKNITQTASGEYIYKNQKVTKPQILQSLRYGKSITINGKLIMLTPDGRDFEFFDAEKINKILRSKINTTPVNLTYVDHDTFFYQKLNKNITRLDVYTNLRKGKHITINNRELAITPDGTDFAYVEEVEQMKKDLKSEAQLNQEASEADVTIVKVPNTLPNYFSDPVSLGDEANDKSKDKSPSYTKTKSLQERLFFMSASSNVINVESKGANHSFDLINFINRYEKLTGQKNVFKNLMNNNPVTFDLSSRSKEANKLWNEVLRLNQAANDSFKEYDDTFLNFGYPCISDTIVEKGEENNPKAKPIKINAPLFFMKVGIMINTKEKQFRFTLTRQESANLFKANKELLLYLATQLNKLPNTLQYDALFNDNTYSPFAIQVAEMKKYFQFLNIQFDDKNLLDIHKNLLSCEMVSPETKIVKNSAGQTINGVRIVSSCFVGVFKQTNADISKDYDKILETPEGREFRGELDALIPEQLKYFEEKGKDFKETGIRQIVQLDYSQKTACKLALTGSLNIVGPAGTGKSQTISNILANFIDRHESALFVAEKKTATDVVAHRMKNLQYYVLPLFAKENWNETLTKALRQNLRRVGNLYGQWKTLKLYDKDNIADISSQILDKNFATIANYREAICSKEGYELPKTIIDFSSGEMHEQLKAVEKLCYSIFKSSHSSVEFWKQINAAKHTRDLWQNISLVLDAVKSDPVFSLDSPAGQDKINRLFKALKYYNSKTLFEDELIQILQADKYDEVPIVNDPNLKKKEHYDAYIASADYIKYEQIIRSLRKTQAPALNMIQDYDGFITCETIRSLKAQVDANRMAQLNTQNYQQNQGGLFGNNGSINAGQVPQQVPAAPVEMTEEEKIVAFASKYNSKNFNFTAVYNYYEMQDKLDDMILQKQLKEQEESPEQVDQENPDVQNQEEGEKTPKAPVDLNLDVSKWFLATESEMNNKINNDLKLTELHFLDYVREQISKNLTYRTQYNELYGIVDNNDRLKNVQATFQKFGQIISLLFPIIIASPNLVCKYLSPKKATFDHIVIDEASMLSLERALPILYRGKKYVIVGDSKQLKPLSLLEQRKRLEELRELVSQGKAKEEDLAVQERIVHEHEGVLDFMAPHIPKTTLQYHYRALKTECVKFSSTVFYDKEMIIADNFSDHEKYLNAGLKVVNVNGEYKNGINIKECDALYEKLVEVARANKEILNSDDKISVGIIVFTQQQKQYLDNLIIQKADPDVLNMKMMLNTRTGEDTSLFIKDIETVQGDERDIILLSLGSSSKSKLSIVESLGLINSDLGNNFLNVMITRARQQLVIFKSFEASDIPSTGQIAVNYYRDFIKYIDLLSQPDNVKVRSELDNLFKPYELRSATIDYSSLVTLNQEYLASKTGLIDLFKQHIDQTKYEIIRNVEPIQGQKFGLVIVDKKTKIPEVAIVFDEFIRDIYKTPKQSQFYDYLFLNSRGWRFNKVTSLEWAYVLNESDSRPDAIKNFIKQKLQFDTVSYYVEEQPIVPAEEVKPIVKEAKQFDKSKKSKSTSKKPIKKSIKKQNSKKVNKSSSKRLKIKK